MQAVLLPGGHPAEQVRGCEGDEKGPTGIWKINPFSWEEAASSETEGREEG